MSGSYRRRDWADEVGKGTETVSVASQLEAWAYNLRMSAKMEVNHQAKATAEYGAAVLAVGAEIVEQLTQISVTLMIMREETRSTPGVVAGTDCKPEEDK